MVVEKNDISPSSVIYYPSACSVTGFLDLLQDMILVTFKQKRHGMCLYKIIGVKILFFFGFSIEFTYN